MPSGIELIKCTAFQIEDMTVGVDVTEFKLSMFVGPNAGANCTGTSTSGRISNNNDLKKVAALQGYTFTNRCVEVQLNWENVTSEGLTVQTVCYYAGINDDE